MIQENGKMMVVDQCEPNLFKELHEYFGALLEDELARKDRAFKARTKQKNQRSHHAHAANRPLGAMLPHLKGGDV